MSSSLIGGAAGVAMAGTLAAVLAVCTVEDLRRRIVPNPALAAGSAVAVGLLAIAEPELLGPHALAALGAAGFLLAPALLRPGSMGMGDVKLAGMTGLYLGSGVVLALLIAFLAGTAAGLALFLRHGISARKMTIPFVPYLALGAGVAAVAA